MNADVHALIGPYVLSALTTDELADFEEHLETCAACREEVASLRDVTAVLAEAEAAAPPVSLRTQVLSAVAVTQQVRPAPASGVTPQARPAPAPASGISDAQPLAAQNPPAEPPAVTNLSDRRRRRMPRLALAAASILVLALVGVGVGTAMKTRGENLAFEHDVMMVTSAPDAHSMDLSLGNAHLVMSDKMDAVVAMGQDAPMPKVGMEYQLWLMMDDGKAMPGPTFMPSSDGEFMAMMHTSFDGVVALAVTEEPHGGSVAPTGAPVAEVTL